MSIFLYRLGGAIGRHPGLVLGTWVLVLAGLLGGVSLAGGTYDDSFSIPGTESQEGQNVLAERFGQTGTSGQILFEARSGKITDAASQSEVGKLVKATDAVKGVSVRNPLTADSPLLNGDKTATIAQVNFSAKVPSDHTLNAVQRAAEPPAGSVVTSSVGGDAYKTTSDPSKVPELLGLLVSFLILAVTFGSLLAAGMPILTALIGVGVTLTGVMLTASFVSVSSTAPTLAEMLGLAVGIDYALFILSRHRHQLADGIEPRESICRALATAGSAVMFAGATVIIALTGLSVAQIPVLTVMGVSAAGAVAVAVSIALTLLPAIAVLLGNRLRPRSRRPAGRPRRRPRHLPRRRPRRRSRRVEGPAGHRPGFAAFWVGLVTRHPVVTVLAVVAVLGMAALPARHLELALPDNSTAPLSTPQRQTYDKITAAFGAGYNAPLAVTADVITSSDPKGTVEKLAQSIKQVPGVVAVPQETPNSGGDTGLVQVIPRGGQTDPSTAALVHRLRVKAPALEKKYGVSDMLVTGQTAINIDASDRLGGALLPFGCIVIGMSLILLMVVFRSLAVPVKATLGYLFSVGAALGAVVAVFQLGWADALVPGLSDSPIVSFLPIFVMGVLFGLAMDYEMFLVSAMREHYVISGQPRHAVEDGFKASARVVTAAALIMTSVFVAFIPAGTSTIKQIALGLAVGVFVDAFLVRMTLVPSVLVLLGRRAWWLPAWLERRVPVVDVEGAALHRKIAFEAWESDHGVVTVLASGLVVREGTAPVDVTAAPGRVTRVMAGTGVEPRELALALAGRRRALRGEVVVCGLLLPEQREAVMRRTALVELDRTERSARSMEDRIDDRVRLLAVSPRGRAALTGRTLDLVSQLADAVDSAGIEPALVEAAMALAAGAEVFVLSGGEALPSDTQGAVEALTGELADRGATVVVVRSEVALPSPIEVVLEPRRVLTGTAPVAPAAGSRSDHV